MDEQSDNKNQQPVQPISISRGGEGQPVVVHESLRQSGPDLEPVLPQEVVEAGVKSEPSIEIKPTAFTEPQTPLKTNPTLNPIPVKANEDVKTGPAWLHTLMEYVNKKINLKKLQPEPLS